MNFSLMSVVDAIRICQSQTDLLKISYIMKIAQCIKLFAAVISGWQLPYEAFVTIR